MNNKYEQKLQRVAATHSRKKNQGAHNSNANTYKVARIHTTYKNSRDEPCHMCGENRASEFAYGEADKYAQTARLVLCRRCTSGEVGSPTARRMRYFYHPLPTYKPHAMVFKKPMVIPEANIQAEIYHRCRLLGIQCCLEYSITPYCRLDIVIIKDGRLVGIVEVKSVDVYEHTLLPKDTTQTRKYKHFGLPLAMCSHMKQIDGLMEVIQNDWLTGLPRLDDGL